MSESQQPLTGGRTASRSFPWVAVSLLCTMVVLATLGLFPVPRIPEPPSDDVGDPSGPGIEMERADVRDSPEAAALLLDLQDPTPLYLPTRWNSGRVDSAMAVERAPGTTFAGFAAKSLVGSGAVARDIPDPVELPTSELVTVTQTERSVVFTELGRVGESSITGGAGGARLEIVRLSDGKTVRSVALKDAIPFSISNEPVEMLAAVDAAGFVASPTVVSSSGDQGLDSQAVAFLGRDGRFSARLGPGIYRISIGP